MYCGGCPSGEHCNSIIGGLKGKRKLPTTDTTPEQQKEMCPYLPEFVVSDSKLVIVSDIAILSTTVVAFRSTQMNMRMHL